MFRGSKYSYVFWLERHSTSVSYDVSSSINKTKVDFGYSVYALRFYWYQNLLFGFRFLAYLMNIIPETRSE